MQGHMAITIGLYDKMPTMKPKSVTLYYQQGTSDKVYKAELIKDDEGWTVNGWNGRRGNTLLQQNKCIGQPYPAAEKIYNDLVKSKIRKGYHEGEGVASYEAPKDKAERQTDYIPQLLNPITEDEAQALILDPDFVEQEKENGKRIGLCNTGTEVYGANKLGLKVGIPKPISDSIKVLGK